MKRLVRIFPQLLLIFLVWTPLLARKCCKVNVAQSQLGCINAELQTILNKVSEIVIDIGGNCDKNVIAIAQSDIPYTTPTSGHYCLQEDVTAAGANAITIDQNNVTLDLNGFHITGGTNGIVSSGTDVVIFDGTVQGATSNGISLTGGSNVNIDSVLLTGNGGNGLNDTGASNVAISNSAANGNTGVGFNVTANNHDFNHVIANGNGGNGLVATGNTLALHDSHFENNGGDGIKVASLQNFCIENSTIQRNTGNGIEASGTSNTGLIQNNCVNGNTAIGITLGDLTNNIQIIENKVLSNGSGLGGAQGIDIGGGVWNNGTTAGGSVTTHTVLSNIAQNNGSTPGIPSLLTGVDTNYSQNLKKISKTPGEMRGDIAAGTGQLQNISI